MLYLFFFHVAFPCTATLKHMLIISVYMQMGCTNVQKMFLGVFLFFILLFVNATLI